MRPIPSPGHPEPDGHDTGEYVAANPEEAAWFTKKEKVWLKRAIKALAGLVLTLSGGGTWSHFSNRAHANEVVEARVKSLEDGQAELHKDVHDLYRAVMWGEHSERLETDGGR